MKERERWEGEEEEVIKGGDMYGGLRTLSGSDENKNWL